MDSASIEEGVAVVKVKHSKVSAIQIIGLNSPPSPPTGVPKFNTTATFPLAPLYAKNGHVLQGTWVSPLCGVEYPAGGARCATSLGIGCTCGGLLPDGW
eukprot:scaffold1552_cov175-Amphora_coffeaeformis.AAC.4